MIPNENLIAVYESGRSLLIQMEQIEKELNSIKDTKLKEVLIKKFKTCAADMIFFTDFIIQLMDCQNSEEMNELIEIFEDLEG